MKQLFMLFALFTGTISIYAQTGKIKGIISIPESNKGALVNIGLNGTSKGTMSEPDGSYEIRQVPPGTYTLEFSYIGLQKKQVEVTVTEGQETIVPKITMEKSDQEISEIQVTGNQYSKYAIEQTSASLRTNMSLLRTAQNIQIVSKQVLQDQQLTDMLEGVTRNTSGAMLIEHWGNFARINMRGFKLPAFRNGMNVELPWGPLTEDLSIVDRIEFVKGPAGFMLSAGEPGGFYNVVTKKPDAHMNNEVSLTIGSFNTLRSTLDIGGKMNRNGRLLYRLNTMVSTKQSHRDFDFNDRYTIAPSLSYAISDQTQLTAEYIFQYSKMAIIGSAYVFSINSYASLDRDYTLAEPNIDPSVMKEHNVYLSLKHHFNEKWNFTAQLGYLHYTGEGSSLWADSVTVDGIYRSMNIWDLLANARMGQFFVNGKETTGSLNHHILAGIDMSDKEYYADWFQGGALGGLLSYDHPVHIVPTSEIPQFDRSLSVRQRSQNYSYPANQFITSLSFYAQDELGLFNDRLLLTLAGRYTSYQSLVYGASTDDQKITPRLGINYEITPTFSFYALYDQAFTPQSGSDKNGNAFKPQEGNDLEAGLKKKWAQGRWQSGLTAFKITKNNVLTSDPDDINYSIQLGEVESKGMEMDITGEILPGLNIILNYAYTDVKTTKDTNPDNVGQRIAGYSKHLTNGWAKYLFKRKTLKGFGLALGYQYMIDRSSWSWGTSQMDGLPNYFRLDGALSWNNEKMAIGININNILDDYLYSGSGYQGQYYYWQSEPGTNFRLNISYQF